MDDRKRVIENLQILRTWCVVNPRHGMGLDSVECEKAVGWLDDALELLKAQQPVEPKWRKGYAYCGQCGYGLHWIVDRNNFCPNCGKAVKWDER